MEFSEFTRMLTGMIAVINPISAIPLYLAFTENIKEQRPEIARITALSVAIILCVCVLIGNHILGFFSITIHGFRIAGGILLMFIAIEMLYAKTSSARHTEEEDKEAIESDSVAVVPLAIPLLAGPGSISTAILFSSKQEGFNGIAMLLLICVMVGALVWVSLRLGPQISERLGRTGMNIFKRIMGLILAAIAVEFIIDGLRNALPGLASAI